MVLPCDLRVCDRILLVVWCVSFVCVTIAEVVVLVALLGLCPSASSSDLRNFDCGKRVNLLLASGRG